MNEISAQTLAAVPSALAARVDRLAEVAIRIGLGLQRGQQLVITAPLEATPLVRRIIEHAYRAGSSLVTTLYNDDVARLARFRYAPADAFDVANDWQLEAMARAYREGAARLAVSGEDPGLLSGEDPDRVSRAARAMSRAGKPAMEEIANFRTNWTIVAAATPGWARLVFPGVPEDEAVTRLWEAIFAASRLDGADPVAAWARHNAELKTRSATMNDHRFSALRFTGPGTDLTVGLSEGHLWLGGSGTTSRGITCNPNIPTEEIFTTPDCRRVEGFVRATKPLSHMGTLIENIAVRFENGRIVDALATAGEALLKNVLATDEGASRLGEVALVPHSSPISQSGILFRNTLFDENASCHIALGQAYSSCIAGGAKMDKTELARRGANESLIHIDWMIGSDSIDIDGLAADGTTIPVMRGGEWA